MFCATKLVGIITLCYLNTTHRHKNPVRNYHYTESTRKLTEQGFAL